ncbi:very long-chain acyl-CoA synthetase [Elysia marginata]|uniref:Long-chain-fatty-acid--CoA ligase n=1 Tax=Elysia marginata TaxID=1093978 RepID=A0AAV4GWK2_9GAST|nr:very long-chain acyl-CoA synthetase [Elysia marginata]
MNPQKTFIVFHKEKFTYAQVDARANRVARVLQSLGFGTSDTLALVMSNEPAFIWVYLGVHKLGARIAVVNHHLMAEALRCSIVSCSPKLVLVGDAPRPVFHFRFTFPRKRDKLMLRSRNGY